MDIAAAFPAKPFDRYAAPARATQSSPQTDDFAAELDTASANAEKPSDAGKTEAAPKKGSKPAAEPAIEDAVQDASDTDQTLVAAPLAPERVASPQIQSPSPTQPGVAIAQTTDQQAAFQALINETSPAATNGSMAQAAGNATSAALELQNSKAAGASDMTAAAALQPTVSMVESLAVPKPAAAGTKKSGESKPESAATAQAASPPAAAQPSPAAPQPVASSGKNGTPQNGGDERQGQSVQPAAGGPAPAPAPQNLEFKPDASAAATAMQPASQATQNASPAAPALVAQNAPIFVPPEALGVAIARKALEGVNKFELRLDPPELGRLDVTLEVDEAGNTRAHIRADRPEALELLQREAKGMEQALRQAGLTLDQSSLSFSLNGREGREAQEGHHHGRRAKFNAVLPEDEITAAALRGTTPSTTGLDLRV